MSVGIRGVVQGTPAALPIAAMDDSFLDLDRDIDLESTHEVILLDTPILAADDYVEDEYDENDENDVETEQVILLDTIRIDDADLS